MKLLIILNIDLRNNQSQQNIFNTLIRLGKNKNWAVFNYEFTKIGSYEISFSDLYQKKVAFAFLLVTSTEKINPFDISTQEICPNIKIIFCEKIKDNKPINFRKKISMKT